MFYFKKIVNGKIVSVESKNVDIPSLGFERATKEEYENFIANLTPEIIEPTIEEQLHELRMQILDKMIANEDFSELKQRYLQLRAKLEKI
ncbi:hypothetical protein DRO97_10210 [Archaeoglobales archaeon]|nr:MAG: hypothetical protein DRO97_10210 [Archaeoglobales archaeon]